MFHNLPESISCHRHSREAQLKSVEQAVDAFSPLLAKNSRSNTPFANKVHHVVLEIVQLWEDRLVWEKTAISRHEWPYVRICMQYHKAEQCDTDECVLHILSWVACKISYPEYLHRHLRRLFLNYRVSGRMQTWRTTHGTLSATPLHEEQVKVLWLHRHLQEQQLGLQCCYPGKETEQKTRLGTNRKKLVSKQCKEQVFQLFLCYEQYWSSSDLQHLVHMVSYKGTTVISLPWYV